MICLWNRSVPFRDPQPTVVHRCPVPLVDRIDVTNEHPVPSTNGAALDADLTSRSSRSD